jgi:hypothetical protein
MNTKVFSNPVPGGYTYRCGQPLRFCRANHLLQPRKWVHCVTPAPGQKHKAAARVPGLSIDGLDTVIGNLPELSPGEHLRMQGSW